MEHSANPFIKASRLIEQTLNLPRKSESQIESAIGTRESGGLHQDIVTCGLLIYDVPMSDKRKWDKLKDAANAHWKD